MTRLDPLRISPSPGTIICNLSECLRSILFEVLSSCSMTKAIIDLWMVMVDSA